MALNSNAVTVKTTANINVYYLEYSKIDLVCEHKVPGMMCI